MPILEAFVTDAIALAATGEECANTATIMHAADTWLQRLARSGARSKANRACLRMRWSLPRVNEIAGTCDELLGRHRANDRTRFMLPPLSNTYQIRGADRKLRQLAQAYLSNPYDPRRIYDLAVYLGVLEFEQPAWQLAEELLQFDSEAAARLEQELTALKPLPYPGFQF